MGKDPAFLFYTADFLTGTQFLTYEQRGKYITLLCLQHQHGHLKDKHMLMVCGTEDTDVIEKFVKDADGLYYHPRLEVEIEKRKRYCDSRSENRMKQYEKKKATAAAPAGQKDKRSHHKAATEQLVYPFGSEKFKQLWGQWKDYKRREHKFMYATRQSEQAALTRLARLCDGTEQAAEAIITESMANGWKGLFELKRNENNGTANDNNRGGRGSETRNANVKRAIYELVGDTTRSF